ncbi:MAG: metallophosphoesterase [Bacteroidetes bacterium]|nr:metallophosphoesterase [Bacteroidota bacterium]
MKKQILSLVAAILSTLGAVAQSSAFSFIHLSDIHVSTVSSAVNQCDVNGAKAQCYLQYFATMSPKPAFILGTGDISNIGNSTAVPGGMYTALTQYLHPSTLMYPGVGQLFIDSARTIPIYLAPGNHEYYTTLTSFSISTQTLPLLDSIPNFVKYIAPDSDYAVSTPISVTLFMRSGHDISYLTSTDPKGSGYTTGQIDWMRSVLMQNQNKRKIIVMHHPPSDAAGYSCGIATFSGNGNDSSSSFVDHRLGFIHLCDSFHVDLVLAGHVHQNVVVDKIGRVIDENCDTCGTRYVQTGPAFAGCYRIISVDSSFITVSRPMLSCDSSASTGMPDIQRELELSVYPEPSNGLFNVSLGQSLPVDIRVYNMLGQLVYHERSEDLVHQVDLRAQPDGMYVLEITSDHDGTPVVYTLKYPLVVSK